MTTKNQLSIVAEPGKQELFITREFDAPRELVFEAYINPDMLVRWLGPKNMKMVIDHYDSRAGGSYRYVHTGPAGDEYAFHGVIHEMSAPNRVIQTFEYEGLPETGCVLLDIIMFEVLPDDRTRVKIHSVYRSVADRDGMAMSGMERGLREGFERLDDILSGNTKSI